MLKSPIFIHSESSDKKKQRISNLPAGVNERDLEMFTYSQEAAKEFLIRENIGIATVPNSGAATTSATGLTDISGTPVRGGPDHGVPTQIAVPHLSASTPGKITGGTEVVHFDIFN